MSVTEWINNRFGVAMNEPALAAIKDFSLIWNVFEDRVCDNNFSIAEVQQRIAENHFNADAFTDHLHYFQNRYINAGETNERFEFLHFRPNDRRDFVRQVLLGELTGVNDILLAIVIIVYRFRNNLFHGLKDIQVIDQQQTNFETSNSFLMAFLDQY
ncbi:MAG: hypothetical protein QM791_00055 [Ferruginibacter sp.]